MAKSEEKFFKVGDIEVGLVKRERIKQRKDNYRRMTAAQRETLQASIDKFGFQSFIVVVREEDQFGVVDGHHRLAELDSRNVTLIPVLILPPGTSKTDADLGMLSFNVSAEIDDEALMRHIRELAEEVDAEELRKHATLSEGFMKAFLDTFADNEPAAPAEDAPTTGTGDGPKKAAKDPKVKIILVSTEENGIVDMLIVPISMIIPSDLREDMSAGGVKMEELEATFVPTTDALVEYCMSAATGAAAGDAEA